MIRCFTLHFPTRTTVVCVCVLLGLLVNCFCFRTVASKRFAFRSYSNNDRKRNCASSGKGQLRTGWFRSVRSASENRLKFCFFAFPSVTRRNSKFANRPHVMQLGQTSTSELLPAAETSQENVQGVAEVRNISHLLREPYARQCLRHHVKHLNQTTRTKSAYTSTTSLKKIRRIIVRDCPCSQSLTIKMSETLAPSCFFAKKKVSVRKTASSRRLFKLRCLTIDAVKKLYREPSPV